MHTTETRTELCAGTIRALTNQELELVSGGMNNFWLAVRDGFVNACVDYYSSRPGLIGCTADLQPVYR